MKKRVRAKIAKRFRKETQRKIIIEEVISGNYCDHDQKARNMLMQVMKVLFISSILVLTVSLNIIAMTAKEILGHAKTLASYGPRVPGSAAQFEAKEYMVRVLTEAGANVEVQEFEHSFLQQKVKLYNVIAKLSLQPEGKAGRQKGILLCTHWDSRPWADQDPDAQKRKRPIIGANDGLSGTALLLALAQDLTKTKMNAPLALVFFDGEDLENPARGSKGLVGSRHFAKNYSLKDYEFGILLDMVGDTDLAIYREQLSEQVAKKINDRVFSLAQKMGIKAFHNWVKHSIIDDHVPLNQGGLPTIDLIDFDYPHWHTSEDTLDKLSGESLLSVGKLLRQLVAQN